MSKLQAPAVRFTPVQIAVWLAGFILLTGNATLIILDRTHSLHIDGLQALRHLALPLGLLCFGLSRSRRSFGQKTPLRTETRSAAAGARAGQEPGEREPEPHG